MTAPAAAPYTPPSRRFCRRLVGALALVGFLVGASIYLRFNPLVFFTEFHHVASLAREMFPPNFGLFAERPSVFASIGETVSMAFLGTLCGGTVAIALALLAASNTTPHPIVRGIVRMFLAAERATPNFIVLLVLLIAVGFGPFAATISLAIGSLGMFGKLFADAIEQVEPGPIEALASTGASRLQVVRYAILPQALPSIVANFFYAFDVNLRGAIALGVYGGGGLGFELNLANAILRYEDTLALILCIAALIAALERVSDFLRRRILQGDALA